MWTYLAILLSIALIISVFVRRWWLMNKTASTDVEQTLQKEDDLYHRLKKRLSRSDKEKVEALCKKAEEKLRVGKEEEAVKLLVQAMAIDELHEEAQHKLAMLYMNKQMFAAAAALFKQLGEMTGEAQHYSHLGLALYQQNEFEEAKQAYQKAVELDDSRPQRFASLATVYRSLGKLQNAIIALNKAIELEKENMDFLLLMVDIQVDLKDFDGAAATLKGILDLEPENEEAREYIKKIQAIRSAEEGTQS